MSTSLNQRLALDQELLNAVRLIHSGLGQLQSLDGANDFYSLPLLTLAGGFERVMKVMLCLHSLESKGYFPAPREFTKGRKGHDLCYLLERVRSECYSEDSWASTSAVQADLAFLESESLQSFLGVLSDFGQSARYHYLDMILGEAFDTNPPEIEWQRLETEIVSSRPDLLKEILDNPASDRIHREVAKEVVGRLERFARALSRIFVMGALGQEGRQFSGYLSKFLQLTEESFGTNEYSPVGASV